MGFAACWLAAFGLYTVTLCPTIAAGDSAELVLAGLSLDVTHPPGYPLLAMLVRLSAAIPAGAPTFRAGLVCAAAGAFAVALLWSTAARLGAPRPAAALAAALFALSPLVWWQSTMLEKYPLQMALAALVLRLTLPPGEGLLRPALAWCIALAHHSMAVFLLPALALAAWRERGRITPRAVAAAVLLGTAVLSTRPVYTAIRSAALHRAEAAGTGARSINWCEPYRAGPLLDYLRVRYYAARFASGTALEHATLRDHLSCFPRELSWPGLLLGLMGIAILARRDPAAGVAVAACLAVSAAFNARFVLPPALAVVYHQDALLLLALCAALGAGAVLRAAGPGPRYRAVAAAAAFALGAWAAPRAPVQDASRHLLVYDFNRGGIALAPRGAVFVASFDYDMFALRWFQELGGSRTDLVPLQAPYRVGPGQFVVRRRYRPWAAALLPGAVLRFTEDDSGFTILRRMVEDNPRLCFAVSAISEPMAPDDVFRPSGSLFVARTASCARAPRNGSRPLRAVSGRGWLSPASRLPVHRVMSEIQAQVLGRASDSARTTAERERLLLERSRLIPMQGSAWAALAGLYARTGRPAEAVAMWTRALELEPAAVETRLDLLRFQLGIGATDAAAALLRDAMGRAPFDRSPAAARALARLDARDVAGAVREANRAFSVAAVEQGRGLPANPESDSMRFRLYRMAAALDPDSVEARRTLVQALHARSRYDEAGPHVRALMRLDPAGARDFALSQAAGWLDLRRVAEARGLLREAARAWPDSAAAFFYLGQAEIASGNGAAGRRALERFLELDPSSPMAPTVREVLAGRKR